MRTRATSVRRPSARRGHRRGWRRLRAQHRRTRCAAGASSRQSQPFCPGGPRSLGACSSCTAIERARWFSPFTSARRPRRRPSSGPQQFFASTPCSSGSASVGSWAQPRARARRESNASRSEAAPWAWRGRCVPCCAAWAARYRPCWARSRARTGRAGPSSVERSRGSGRQGTCSWHKRCASPWAGHMARRLGRRCSRPCR
jgi:hypothetical protein